LPLSQSEANTAAGIKSGEIASAVALRVADGEIAKAYGDHGYRGARVTHQSTLDHAAHTASYTFAIVPGDIYHLASVDISALTPEQQAAFTNSFHTAPGAIADISVNRDIAKAVFGMNGSKSITISMNIDNANHTVKIVLKPKTVRN
jgi:outer membrane protein assembly factor BamA